MSHAESPPHPPVRRPVRTGKFLLLLGVAAIALAVSGFRGRGRDEMRLAKWTQDRAIPTVELAEPSHSGATRRLTLPGDVEAFYNATLHGQVGGYVRAWNFDIGAQVKKGDVLAEIDTP